MQLDDDENEEEAGTDDHRDSIAPGSPATGTSQMAKRRKKEIADSSDVDKTLIDYLSSNKKNEDAHYFFGMSIAEKLRGMPTARAAYARMKIEQVLAESKFFVVIKIS